jgi:hypothetical protein
MSIDQLRLLRPRPGQDVAAMGLAVQANLVQLQTALARRFRGPPSSVPPPGPITRYRETLIDWRTLKGYDEPLLNLRLREIWGQHCLICWTFHESDPTRPPAYADLSGASLAGPAGNHAMRCAGELGAKLSDITQGLWRLRHEQRLRHDPAARQEPEFRKQQEAAMDMPMLVYGENVRVCADGDLLSCACEYAGMLAAIRWISDDRWTWGRPGIMELDGAPSVSISL